MLPVELRASVPALIKVAPVYVLAAFNVVVPVPDRTIAILRVEPSTIARSKLPVVCEPEIVSVDVDVPDPVFVIDPVPLAFEVRPAIS